MRILLVEDDQAYIEAISQILTELPGPPKLIVAQSKCDATDQLQAGFFDLILLDLRIPTEDGLLDADPRHGRNVFYVAREHAPGTPIFVLTGSPAEDFIEDFLGSSQRVDIWSEGRKTQMVQFMRKYNFQNFRPQIEVICKALWELSEVELSGPHSRILPIEHDRLMRIFAKRYGATRCEFNSVSGGFSRANVYRLRVTSAEGACIHNAIGKLGSVDDIHSEGERFDTYVSRLDSSATPRKLCVLEVGAGKTAGVFYSLASDYPYDGFTITHANPEIATSIPETLSATLRPWCQGVPETRRTIGEIRRSVVADQDSLQIREKFPVPWADQFETRSIQARWCQSHGDLHGKNILIADDGRCVVIDYGDVGFRPASLDPITYELSFLFHPDGSLRTSGWPTLSQALHWGDLDLYLADCPIETVIQNLRHWTISVAAGKREIAASAYSYLLRQYKYPDNDPQLINALLDGVFRYFSET